MLSPAARIHMLCDIPLPLPFMFCFIFSAVLCCLIRSHVRISPCVLCFWILPIRLCSPEPTPKGLYTHDHLAHSWRLSEDRCQGATSRCQLRPPTAPYWLVRWLLVQRYVFPSVAPAKSPARKDRLRPGWAVLFMSTGQFGSVSLVAKPPKKNVHNRSRCQQQHRDRSH